MAVAPAGAAPLCRDTRGLFTPCPNGLNRIGHRQLAERIASSSGDRGVSASLRPVSAGAIGEVVVRNRPHATLCRDYKGLFTPCAR